MSKSLQVHVGWLEGGTAVFAFRGTASKQDGLQDVKIFSRNIDYLQELYPGVKAHLGALLAHSLAHWLTCSPTGSFTASPSASLTGSLSLTYSLTPSHSLTHSHSLTLYHFNLCIHTPS